MCPSTFSKQTNLTNPGDCIHCGEVFSGKALAKVDRFVAYIFIEITKSVMKIGLRKCCAS